MPRGGEVTGLVCVAFCAFLVLEVPLSNECGKYKTVKARLWPWLSGKVLNTF
jgi:hypothetical protein